MWSVTIFGVHFNLVLITFKNFGIQPIHFRLNLMTEQPVKEFSHLFKLLSLFHAGLLWSLSAVMKRYDSYYITQTGMIFYHRNICPTGYFFIWLFVSGYFWISVHLEVQSYDLALNLKPWFNISFESVVIV